MQSPAIYFSGDYSINYLFFCDKYSTWLINCGFRKIATCTAIHEIWHTMLKSISSVSQNFFDVMIRKFVQNLPGK